MAFILDSPDIVPVNVAMNKPHSLLSKAKNMSTESVKMILTKNTSNYKMSYKITQLYMLYITTLVAKPNVNTKDTTKHRLNFSSENWTRAKHGKFEIFDRADCFSVSWRKISSFSYAGIHIFKKNLRV